MYKKIRVNIDHLISITAIKQIIYNYINKQNTTQF